MDAEDIKKLRENFRGNRKIMNVIDSNSLERDAGKKPVSTFSHPPLVTYDSGHLAALRQA